MPSETVLTTRALNRALLARQHLLERAPMAPAQMIEHLVGMQAQNPHDPYIGLWSRVKGFAADELSMAIEGRQAVRMGLLRTTLHLVTARDAIAMWPVVRGVLERAYGSSPFRKDLVGVDHAAIVAAGRAALDEAPLTMSDLGKRLAERWPDRKATSLGYTIRFHAPIVQVPPRGLWGRSGQARWQNLETWLGQSVDGDPAPDPLVLRYLAAFGPASVADIATWSWLTGVREVVERLRPRLRTFRDERGRELFDLPDAPRPPEDTPAPVRFLPEYDNIALSHEDRSRIFVPEAAGRITGWVGTFTVDGFISGQWRLDRGREATTLIVDPFVSLRKDQREALVEEATRLAAFAAHEAAARTVEFGVAREAAPDAPGLRTGAPRR